MTIEEAVNWYETKLIVNETVGLTGNQHEAAKLALAALREQRERTNNPVLTLEQLREMDGEPVWCVDGSGNGRWAIVCVYGENPDEFECYTTQYGRIPGWECGFDVRTGWIAYRYKPEEGTR